MSGTDPRVIRTRQALHATLLSAVEQHGSEITVTTLCAMSGLNRGTFYLHYADVNALAMDVALTLVRDIVKQWRALDTDDPKTFTTESRDLLASYLRHVDEKRAFYAWLLSQSGSWLTVHHMLHAYTEAITHGRQRSAHPEEADVRSPAGMMPSFLAGALFGVVARWITDPPSASAEEVADWLWRELGTHSIGTSEV